MKKNPKDQARSIGARLSKISKELGVPYPKIVTDFLLERLAVRLVSNPELAGKLVFKGGYVSLRVYDSPRYTVDLDALLRSGSLSSVVSQAKAVAESDYGDAIWFRMEETVDLKTQGEYGGLRLVFRAGIGEILSNLRRAQIINLDIGVGDPVVPGPVDVETPFLLGEGTLSWRVYPVETTVSEKLHNLIVRGSNTSRSKDIFDLNLLLKRCDAKHLKRSLAETFRHRGDTLPAKVADHIRDIDCALLKAGWANATDSIKTKPDFEEEFESLVRQLEEVL